MSEKKNSPTNPNLVTQLNLANQRIKDLENALAQYRLHENIEWQIKELYQNLIHILPDSIILTDVKGNIIMANKQAALLYGFVKMEEMLGKNILQFISCSDRKRADKDIRSLLEDKLLRSIQYQTIKQDNSTIVVEVSASLIRDRDNIAQAFIIFLRDITQRKKLEENLKESQEQYRTTIDFLNEAIHVVDKDLKILLFNKQFKLWSKELSLDVNNVIGKNLYNVFPFLPSEIAQEYSQVFETGNTLITQEDVRIGERSFITETKKIPVFEGDKVIRVITVITDITQRTRLDELKDEFITTVSHELRTPLAIIKSGINLLLDRIPGQLNDKQNEVLVMIKDNSNRLIRIVTDLLNLALFNTGKVQLIKEKIDFKKVIKEIVTSLKPKAQAKGIQLRVALPEGKMEIYADLERIKIAFSNLLGNGIKFTNFGYVDASFSHNDKEVVCKIIDTGVGITPKDLYEIFSKPQTFSLIVEKDKEGRGLGLAITKKIIDMHNGSISVESKINKGTEFKVVLPKCLTQIKTKNVK